MRNHVLPRWERSPLSGIDHSAVQAWVKSLGERLSPASVSECFRITSGVMRSAVRDRLVGHNPCEGVKVARRRRMDTDDQTITREELALASRQFLTGTGRWWRWRPERACGGARQRDCGGM